MTLPSFLRRFGSTLAQRPLIVVGTVAILFVGYLGWQAEENWFDRPLPASSVAARKLQVNNVGLQSLLKRLDAYRHPETNRR